MKFDRRGFLAGAVALVAAGRMGFGQPLTVRVQFEAGGRVSVASQGCGEGEVAQIVADALNLRSELVDVSLGSTSVPMADAVRRAALLARAQLLGAVAGDAGSPLHGAASLDFVNGRIIHKDQPESGESFNAFLARNRNVPVGAMAFLS
jgi:CO/xanthine dehydrogenase Mo-binding subunit